MTQEKQDGTLKPRLSFIELFSPELRRTTIVTTILSACGYAAAFGAIQMTPLQIVAGLPDIAAQTADAMKGLKAAETKLSQAKEGTTEAGGAAEDGNVVR